MTEGSPIAPDLCGNRWYKPVPLYIVCERDSGHTGEHIYGPEPADLRGIPQSSFHKVADKKLALRAAQLAKDWAEVDRSAPCVHELVILVAEMQRRTYGQGEIAAAPAPVPAAVPVNATLEAFS